MDIVVSNCMIIHLFLRKQRLHRKSGLGSVLGPCCPHQILHITTASPATAQSTLSFACHDNDRIRAAGKGTTSGLSVRDERSWIRMTSDVEGREGEPVGLEEERVRRESVGWNLWGFRVALTRNIDNDL